MIMIMIMIMIIIIIIIHKPICRMNDPNILINLHEINKLTNRDVVNIS